MPSSNLTGYADAVQHQIDTGNHIDVLHTGWQLNMVAEEKFMDEMLPGGQIDENDIMVDTSGIGC